MTHIRSMDAGGYRHNYESFCEKTLYQMSINRERTTTSQDAHASLVGILSFLLLSLLVKSFEEEIQPSSTDSITDSLPFLIIPRSPVCPYLISIINKSLILVIQ